MRAIASIFLLSAAAMTTPASAHLGGGRLDYVYTLKDINDGAQLRAEAAIVIPIVFYPCGSSGALEPVQNRYATFVEGLTQIRQRIDLDIALADFNYQMSLVDIACPDADAPETLEHEKTLIAVANSVLDRMDRLVEPVSGQDK